MFIQILLRTGKSWGTTGKSHAKGKESYQIYQMGKEAKEKNLGLSPPLPYAALDTTGSRRLTT